MSASVEPVLSLLPGLRAGADTAARRAEAVFSGVHGWGTFDTWKMHHDVASSVRGLGAVVDGSLVALRGESPERVEIGAALVSSLAGRVNRLASIERELAPKASLAGESEGEIAGLSDLVRRAVIAEVKPEESLARALSAELSGWSEHQLKPHPGGGRDPILVEHEGLAQDLDKLEEFFRASPA